MTQAHYQCPDLQTRIEAGLALQGKSPNSLTLADLAPVDEFHLLGAKATNVIIKHLPNGPDKHLLDLGSGLGGPARQVAQQNGCNVTGVDLSDDYCQVARTLSQWLGMDDTTQFIQGDVTALPDLTVAHFDGAFSIHVGMNIRNRESFYQQAANVLKPGAGLVLYDIFSSDDTVTVRYPMPWASKAEHSFLLTQQQTRTALNTAGFTVTQSIDFSEAVVPVLGKLQSYQAKHGKPPLGLHTLLGDVVDDIFANLQHNFESGALQVKLLIAALD